MIKYWCEDEITKKEFIATCSSQFNSEFEQLFGEILRRSECSLIRTSILEVALALTSAGFPLNGFNFDEFCGSLKVVASAEANKLASVKQEEASIAIWRPLEAKVHSQLQLFLSNSHDDV